MHRTSFNDGCIVGSKTDSFAELIAGPGSEPSLVALPHDALIAAQRSPSGHGATAHFPSGTCEYRTSFGPPADDAGTVGIVEFDGVCRDSRVLVDALVAHGPNGSSCTTFDGRALAIVRPTAEGRITLTEIAEGCEAPRVVIDAHT